VHALKCGRQEMLAVVLLHVIEAPVPVDFAVYLFGVPACGVHQVEHLAIPLLGIDHGGPIEGAAVSRLTASLGIKRASVQDDGELAIALHRSDDSRVKAPQVRIGEVKSLGH